MIRSQRRLAFALAPALVSMVAIAVPVAAADSPYHHLHLTATDAKAGGEWYAEHIGGELVGDGRVMFDDVLVVFFQKDEFEGSDGSSVDHVGFSYEDLDAKMAAWKAAGIPVLMEPRDVNGLFKFGFIEDPWGTKLEVMQDAETLGFHHIHLKSTDPEGTFGWYSEAFGGEKTKYKGLLDALLYDDVWLMVQNSDAPMAATEGRAIDHLSWSFPDLAAAAEMLKSKGVVFTMEPRPFRNIKIAFIEGPDGVRIELVEPAKE